MADDLVERFLDWMRRRHHAEATVSAARLVVRAFLAHLERGGRAVADVDPDSVRAYLRERRRLYGPPADARGPAHQRKPRRALRRFVSFLAERGEARPLPSARPTKDLSAVPGFAPLLGEYRTYLLDHRGFASSTVRSYLDYIGRLCCTVRRRRIEAWDDVPPEILYGHLRRQARRLGRESLRKTQSAWRGFFRWLRATGRCAKDLAAVLVRCRIYSQAPLPKAAPPGAIDALLADVEGDDPLEIRDRAILVLLLSYGLRGGEVARLALDDVRWRAGVLVVRGRKNGRDLSLPLLPPVASALARYLRSVRPSDSAHRQVFLDRWGRRPFARSAGRVLYHRIARLGFAFPPHALRHTWASLLLNRGCPPARLSVLLGHADFDSTRIYAKVDLVGLREVARLEDVP